MDKNGIKQSKSFAWALSIWEVNPKNRSGLVEAFPLFISSRFVIGDLAQRSWEGKREKNDYPLVKGSSDLKKKKKK